MCAASTHAFRSFVTSSYFPLLISPKFATMSISLTVSYFATASIFLTRDSVELVPNGKSVTGHNIVLLPFTYGSHNSIYAGLIQIVAHSNFTPSFVNSTISFSVNSGFKTE